MSTISLTGLCIMMVISIILLPARACAATQSTAGQGVTIENEDVLQACVTVLIGVLIFLTLERKFEKRDVATEVLYMGLDRDRLKSEFDSLANVIEKAEKKFSEETDEYEKASKRRRIFDLKQEQAQVEARLNSTKKAIENVEAIGARQDVVARVYQKIKDREDLVNSIVVTLLSACIIFMIFVPIGWNYGILDYSVVSRILFVAGTSVLVCRVFLYALDVKLTKSVKS
jgi:hypothetical protein